MEQIDLFKNYDTVATSYKYSRIRGPFPGNGGMTSVGANTTLTASVSGVGTFSGLAAGDILEIRKGDSSTNFRVVNTVTSPDEISVTSAIDVSTGYASWNYYKVEIGTAATSGWVPCQSFHGGKDVLVKIAQTGIGDAGGIDVVIEGRHFGQTATNIVLYEQHYDQAEVASGPVSGKFPIPELVGWLRVGLKGTTGFAGTDDITVYLVGDSTVS